MTRDDRPPALAEWIASRLTGRHRRDALIGDLAEEYGRGRSSMWYWRQVLGAVVAGARHGLTWQFALWTLRLAIIGGVIAGGTVAAKWPIFILAWDPFLYGWLYRRHRQSGRRRLG